MEQRNIHQQNSTAEPADWQTRSYFCQNTLTGVILFSAPVKLAIIQNLRKLWFWWLSPCIKKSNINSPLNKESFWHNLNGSVLISACTKHLPAFCTWQSNIHTASFPTSPSTAIPQTRAADHKCAVFPLRQGGPDLHPPGGFVAGHSRQGAPAALLWVRAFCGQLCITSPASEHYAPPLSEA